LALRRLPNDALRVASIAEVASRSRSRRRFLPEQFGVPQHWA
jgi:hypothetical protein